MKHRVARVGGLLVASMAISFCTSVRPTKFPTMGCYVSCKDGRPAQFGHQHLCFGGGSRYFTDVLLKSEYIERNGDGTIKVDNYITEKGDYPAAEVEPQSCHAYIDQVIQSRSVEQRGIHPGEDDHGQPNHK